MKAFLVKMVEHVVRCMTQINTCANVVRETMEHTVRMVTVFSLLHKVEDERINEVRQGAIHFKIVYKLTKAAKISLRRRLDKGTQRAN